MEKIETAQTINQKFWMKLIEKFLTIIFEIWNKFSMLFKFLDSTNKF